MDKWQGRVACVTGASGGIGADITKALADAGMTVIGLSRRIEPIQVRVIQKSLPIPFYSYKVFTNIFFAVARSWPIKRQLAKLLQRNVT